MVGSSSAAASRVPSGVKVSTSRCMSTLVDRSGGDQEPSVHSKAGSNTRVGPWMPCGSHTLRGSGSSGPPSTEYP